MRALRILVIVAVILGGLFVVADHVAVGFAEDEVAQKLKSSEGLTATPDVSINGFPFLTQVAGGELDDVEVGISDYEATTGNSDESIRIADLTAHMRGVKFSGDYSSATAASATGTATISYDELLKAAKSEPTRIFPGVTAQVTGLSDGGNGKIKVNIKVSALGSATTYPVLSTVTVDDDIVKVHADNLPNLVVQAAEGQVRSITDFQQRIDGLPGGIKLDKVEAAPDGVDISVKGSNIQLAG
ncbi:LmeA family phospholipid-binding protein [Streptomyces neyagawaensis]|uniref:LmeA family phospholipid-binding protein n=1 Tax=Streptomyces neyagawaensis TaxID=42238 RepID=UPI0006E2D352|nr:DUF2993 domain-containing protein [Streptomyces neyagawaensis]MCL6736957.1 DUF2993 domain-containing protein [Streptomyces neyagawaensis]MDE1687293.1 DUF2993 domain-containing protein [Streptomyces neyagawaensis]